MSCFTNQHPLTHTVDYHSFCEHCQDSVDSKDLGAGLPGFKSWLQYLMTTFCKIVMIIIVPTPGVVRWVSQANAESMLGM